MDQPCDHEKKDIELKFSIQKLLNFKSQMKNKTIDIVIENFLYGGTTTHLLNFINSKTCKNYKFRIITNKNNVAIQSIRKTCDMERVKIVQYQSFNYFQLQSYSLKIIFFILKPIFF